METIQIQNFNVTEFRELIKGAVKSVLEQNRPKQEPETELLTRIEVAELLGVSLVTLSSWIQQGKIPALRIGTRIRFKKSDVLNSLKEVQSLKYGRA